MHKKLNGRMCEKTEKRAACSARIYIYEFITGNNKEKVNMQVRMYKNNKK